MLLEEEEKKSKLSNYQHYQTPKLQVKHKTKMCDNVQYVCNATKQKSVSIGSSQQKKNV